LASISRTIAAARWHPRLAYGREGEYCNSQDGKPPLVRTDTLDSGAYVVVVGGADAGAHGRYTLRIDPVP
jgi:hypothetical protein